MASALADRMDCRHRARAWLAARAGDVSDAEAALIANLSLGIWRTVQTPNGDLTISFRYELEDSGRLLRATERLRGAGREQDNVWVFDRAE
jgi:hypothetical protein